ncbi:MAG: choice-of-anchor P family protein [Stellaceae bacterium]
MLGAAAVLAWPLTGAAQTLTGQATAAQATVFGLLGTNVLSFANTGTLSSPTGALDASQLSGNILGALTAEVPQASTIGYPDQVDSAASLANFALSIAGNAISADFVNSEATAVLNGASSGTATLTNLSLNGVPVAVSGAPNQAVYLPGGQMVINEQQTSPGGIVVNALHIIVNGVADVVVGSAVASIQ